MGILTLSLLGSMQLRLGNTPVVMYDRVRALLVYLAVEADRPQRRPVLASLFWPNQPERNALRNLSQALLNLRKALGEQDEQSDISVSFVLASADTLQFNPSSDYWLDVAEFLRILDECDIHPHRYAKICTYCAQRYIQAADLYRGDFLEDFTLSGSNLFDDWVHLKREHLRQRMQHALTWLASYYEQRGEYEQAYQYAHRGLILEPWDETVHEQVLRALALGGKRGAALAHYERYRRMFQQEFGAEPGVEMVRLHTRIQRLELAAIQHSPLPATNLTIHTPATPFVGRETELLYIAQQLNHRDCRLLTLVGPGGSGKTRLALHAAAQQQAIFPQGVYFVSLASISSPEFIVFAIAEAVGFSFGGTTEPKVQLFNYLSTREALLILDNFEHLIESGTLVVELLQHAPKVVLLVTSREKLDLGAEWLMDITGLSVPQDDTLATLETSSASQLFVQTAKRVQQAFLLSPTLALSVVQICQLVEGLPLGVELAAALVRTQSCAEIAQGIQSTLDHLITNRRDIPDRHRSIRAVFDHSWQLLALHEQRVLARLAIFRGGFLPEAAAKVAGATEGALSSLVAKSLLRQQPTNRYDLHELLRQYLLEKLVEHGGAEEMQARHLNYFLTLAQTAETQLRGAEQIPWLALLDAEQDNLRAALAWGQEAIGHIEQALSLASALWQYWVMRGYLSEGRTWLSEGLRRTETIGKTTGARAKALNALGLLVFHQDDYAAARLFHEQAVKVAQSLNDKSALAYALFGLHRAESRLVVSVATSIEQRTLAEEPVTLFKEIGDVWGTAMALNQLGTFFRRQGDYAHARTLHEESLAISQSSQDQRSIARAFNNLGLVAQAQGDLANARSYFATSLAINRKMGDKWGISGLLINVGEVARQQGDDDQAETYYQESLVLAQEMGAKAGIGLTLHNLGCIAQHRGDYPKATVLVRQSLRLYCDIGRIRHIAMCLATLGSIAGSAGNMERAVRLCGAAAGLYASIKDAPDPADKLETDRTLAVVQAHLPKKVYALEWNAGWSMTLEQAIAYAENDQGE